MADSIFVHTQQKMRSQVSLILLFAAIVVARPMPMAAATPDTVLEWNAIMNTTVLTDHTNPLFTSRVVALVSASVFDAVNGIKPRYKPLHVRPDAPRHASQRAAAIQAAYAILIKLYPAQSDSLTQQRDASIAAITSKKHAESIQAGITWGEIVAESIWTWRETDGFTPPPRHSSASLESSDRPQQWVSGGQHRWVTSPAPARSSPP